MLFEFIHIFWKWIVRVAYPLLICLIFKKLTVTSYCHVELKTYHVKWQTIFKKRNKLLYIVCLLYLYYMWQCLKSDSLSFDLFWSSIGHKVLLQVFIWIVGMLSSVLLFLLKKSAFIFIYLSPSKICKI